MTEPAIETAGSRMPERLYFRQLLAGRDFAVDDPIARQMVNFCYVIGDRTTGEAVVVDPAYAVGDVPVHVQGAEAPWVTRSTGIAESELARHASGDVVSVGVVPIELVHTPGH